MTYGVNARVGNKIVFTREGAIEAYKIFCNIFNKDMSIEASVVLGDASLDMYKLGFTPEEVEAIEISTIA